MWWWVLLAGLALGAGWLIVPRVLLYQKLFGVPHLMEFAHGLPALKQAAMRQVTTGGELAAPSPSDGRILQTSAGLVFVHTVSIHPDGGYAHHASVSLPGRVTAHAVGETFILLWARLLGVDVRRLVLQVSPATVHHAEFVLNNGEQDSFARRPVETPTEDMLKAFHAECLTVRQNMRAVSGQAAAGS
jgi:hypothetical protein